MAVHLTISNLTYEEKSKIAKDLCLYEKVNPFLVKDREKKSINFFQILNDEKTIALPYYYASELLNLRFPNNKLEKKHIETFEMSDNFKLYDYQEEAISLANEDIMETCTCFFNVFCSFGKTVIGSKLASDRSKEGLITLVVYPRKIIGKSWEGTFKNLTKANVILFEKGVKIPENVQVILCMDTQILNLPIEILNNIGHLIIDEAHMFCTPSNVSGLLSITPKYITCLTATYERDDGFEIMLDLIVGPNRIVRISKKPFFVIQLNTKYEPQEIKIGDMGIIFDDLISKIDIMEDRTRFIYELICKNIQHKILILTKHIMRVEKLYTELCDIFGRQGIEISRYAGKDKTYKDGDIIIGTISKIGLGFDEKEACENWNGRRINFLILDSSTKKIEQIAGRVFRSPIPVIVDIVDKHNNLKKHWNIRRTWYLSRNGIIYQTENLFKWNELYVELYDKHLLALQKEKEKEKENENKKNSSYRINGRVERENRNRDYQIESDDFDISELNINIKSALLKQYSNKNKN